MTRSLLTTDGKITYSRYVLRPANPASREKLFELDGANTVIPLDCALRVNGLPFKMTVSMMLEVAFYATVLDSYQSAEEIIAKIYGMPVNDLLSLHKKERPLMDALAKSFLPRTAANCSCLLTISAIPFPVS